LEDTFKRQHTINEHLNITAFLSITQESQNSNQFSGTHHPFNIHCTAISCARKSQGRVTKTYYRATAKQQFGTSCFGGHKVLAFS